MEIAAAIIIVEAAAITTAAITAITTVTIIIVITAAIIVVELAIPAVELVATAIAEVAAIMNVTTTAAETAAAATATAGVIGPDSGTDIIRVTMPAATLELCLLQLLLSMMAVVVVTPEVPVTNPSDFVMTSLSLCRQPPAGGTFFKSPCYFAGRKGYHTFLSLLEKNDL